MQFRLISNYKTVVCQDDGTVRKIRHNPPLGYREVLSFLYMLFAPDRQAPASRTSTSQPEAPVTTARGQESQAEDLLPKSPDEIVGYFQCGGTSHPLTVLSGAGILKALCGKAQHLGLFAVELYQEAARVLGYGDQVPVVLPEPELRHKFARTIRAILPDFRRIFQERHRGREIEGSYSRLLFGTGKGSGTVVEEQDTAGSKDTSPDGSGGKQEESSRRPGSDSGSDGCPTGRQDGSPGATAEAGGTTGGEEAESHGGGASENERRKASYNRVMGTTVRAVLELTLPSVGDVTSPDVSGIDFASVAKRASDIRRERIGNKRGADILPRTALRILGRCVSLKLGAHELRHMTDEQLVAMFIPLAARDERVLLAQQ